MILAFFKSHDFSRFGKCFLKFPGFPWFSRPLGTLRNIVLVYWKILVLKLSLYISWINGLSMLRNEWFSCWKMNKSGSSFARGLEHFALQTFWPLGLKAADGQFLLSITLSTLKKNVQAESKVLWSTVYTAVCHQPPGSGKREHTVEGAQPRWTNPALQGKVTNQPSDHLALGSGLELLVYNLDSSFIP